MNAQISEAGMRESDLLAFEIALSKSDAGAVMAAYNLVNGLYNSSNNHLLNDILKGDFGFKGFIESDANLGIQSALDANTGIDFDITRIALLRTFPVTGVPSYF